MTNSRLTDPEVLELRYPGAAGGVPRSGAAPAARGKWRAGDGTLRVIRFLERMECAILSGFRSVPPFGLAGRLSPAKADATGSGATTGGSRTLKGCDQTVLEPGEAIIIKTPTGGGFG